jgi:hypothetical protein
MFIILLMIIDVTKIYYQNISMDYAGYSMKRIDMLHTLCHINSWFVNSTLHNVLVKMDEISLVQDFF